MSALARNSDPITSHIAAANVINFADTHRNMILAALEKYGPMTAHEIAEHINLLPHQILKRFPELHRQGLIATTGETRQATGRTPARVWRMA